MSETEFLEGNAELVFNLALRLTGNRADADFGAFPAERVELAACTVVDLGVSLRPFSARAALGASAIELQVQNLLDTDYQMAYGFPAQGRTILIGVRVGSD